MNEIKDKFNKFIVPFELKNDIVYCQRSLRQYIHMHQILVSIYASDDLRVRDLEKEIIDIGREQKIIIDNLRLNMETYFLNLEASDVQIDRQKINQQITRQLSKYCPSKYDIIEPLNVNHRLNESELFDKYIYSKGIFNKNVNVDVPMTEEMEVLVSPQDMIFMTSNSVNGQQTTTTTSSSSSKSQVSLLKPKSERGGGTLSRSSTEPLLQTSTKVVATAAAAPATKPSAAINNSRMNLLQALKKAKSEKIANRAQAAAAAAAIVAAQPIVPIRIPSIIQKSKSSHVSSTSSAAATKTEMQQRTTSNKIPTPVISPEQSVSSESDGIDLPEEEPEPLVLGKEAFLRVVDLCTQTYKEYILSRRSERKRRNVTSTERGDFHYGKLELFERQSSKNSKRQMLLSPTRTSRKTNNSANAAYNANAIYNNANSSTNATSSTAAAVAAAKTSSAITATATISSTKSNPIIAPIVVPPNEKRSKSLSPPSTSNNSTNDKVISLVCMICLKETGELLNACEICSGAYHKLCHKRHHRLRERYCPHCMRLNYTPKIPAPTESTTTTTTANVITNANDSVSTLTTTTSSTTNIPSVDSNSVSPSNTINYLQKQNDLFVKHNALKIQWEMQKQNNEMKMETFQLLKNSIKACESIESC